MHKIHEKLLKICEYVFVLIILVILCYFFNKNINIYGLYMDDLYNWSYFPETNIFTFAFKFYENATRYRPFYDMFQYIEYAIVGHKPILFSYFNIGINSLIALFIYYFCKKLNSGSFISLLISILYLFSHFSYYQIGQSTGLIESMALFLSILILYKSIMYVRSNNKNDFKILLVLFLCIAFTHERFLFMYGIIVMAIIFSEIIRKINLNNIKNIIKIKLKSILSKVAIISIEVFFILIIRKLALGKIVPAGTGGTYVENTFDLKQMLSYCYNQIQYIIGINNGPDYLCGINFVNISNMIRKITIAHIFLFLFVIIFYFIIKIYALCDRKSKTKKLRCENIFMYIIKNYYIDILMLMYIMFAIIFSSVTIRVEMRFVYTSFTVCFIYLAYMISYIKNIKFDTKIMHYIFVISSYIIMISIFLTRLPVEKIYRDNYNMIYFFGDQARMNSLANNTVYKYGEDIIDKKQVYILHNFYNMSKFYGDYFFQIYQKNYELRPIKFIESVDEIDKNELENAIILEVSDDFLGFKEFTLNID